MIVKLENGRFVFHLRFLGEQLDLIRQLPDARGSGLKYTATATPHGARVIVDAPYVDHDVEVRDLAESANGEGLGTLVVHTDPWDHQLKAIRHAMTRHASYLAMDMGTGKSKCVVDVAVNTGAKRILVLCPKSVVGVWPREFERHAPGSYDVVRLDQNNWTSKRKAEFAKKRLHSRSGPQKRPTVVAVNYETSYRPDLAKVLLAEDWDLVVLDEAHRIKSTDRLAKQAGFACKVGARAKRRMCLSGTPTPHSPYDWWSQFRFLDAAVFGSSFGRFRGRYSVVHQDYPGLVLRWINQDELCQKIEPYLFSVSADDVLDLPDISHDIRPVEMPMRAYRQLEADAIAVLGDLEQLLDSLADKPVVQASNDLVKLIRLQQMAAGFAVDEEDRIQHVHEAKLEALRDVILDNPHDDPIVVFCSWREDLRRLEELVERLSTKDEPRVYGEISGTRKDLTPEATLPEGISVVGVQWQAGSVGIDLSRARIGVVYSPTFNAGNTAQAYARLHRPGQERPVAIYHLLCKDTVEEKIHKIVSRRLARQEQFLANA